MVFATAGDESTDEEYERPAEAPSQKRISRQPPKKTADDTSLQQTVQGQLATMPSIPEQLLNTVTLPEQSLFVQAATVQASSQLVIAGPGVVPQTLAVSGFTVMQQPLIQQPTSSMSLATLPGPMLPVIPQQTTSAFNMVSASSTFAPVHQQFVPTQQSLAPAHQLFTPAQHAGAPLQTSLTPSQQHVNLAQQLLAPTLQPLMPVQPQLAQSLDHIPGASYHTQSMHQMEPNQTLTELLPMSHHPARLQGETFTTLPDLSKVTDAQTSDAAITDASDM